MRLFAVLILLSALLQFPIPAASVTIHVPGDYATICEATAVAECGDTVLVGPGIHYYPVYDCPSIRDGVVLTSESGPEETTLYAWVWGPYLGGLITFEYGGVSSATEISGFTILVADLGQTSVSAVIWCRNWDSPRIRKNLIRPDPSFPYVFGDATGIGVDAGAEPLIMNNTIVGAYRGIYAWTESSPMISHNILFDCIYGVECFSGSDPALSCNVFWQSTLFGCEPGEGDIFEDPLFCDVDSHDYSLRCDSPAAHGYGCGLIGALGVGCGPTATVPTTWGLVKSLFDVQRE